MKEATLYRKLSGKKVICTACARRCQIPDGSQGFCFVRQNEGGKLYLANYGKLEAMAVDPIEKKPFNHFMPGSYVFGIGTASCNLGCLFCQNPSMSKSHKIRGTDVTPEGVVDLAIENGASGIAYTYNEPTIFLEYTLDVAKIARKRKMYNVFVTNGYMTAEAIKMMKGLVDAAVVDFKGNGEQKFVNKYSAIVSSDPIKETLLGLKKAGIHTEITDLVVPQVGESTVACNELTKWVHDSLGPDVPMQFTRFYPAYKMADYPETSYDTLKNHYDIAKRNGINYAYIGNMVGNPYESTYCPECGELVVERHGFYITNWRLDKNNRCPSCRNTIPIVGNPPERFRYEDVKVVY